MDWIKRLTPSSTSAAVVLAGSRITRPLLGGRRVLIDIYLPSYDVSDYHEARVPRGAGRHLRGVPGPRP
jgi:hypothetical protein